jgi:hypothetical protein
VAAATTAELVADDPAEDGAGDGVGPIVIVGRRVLHLLAPTLLARGTHPHDLTDRHDLQDLCLVIIANPRSAVAMFGEGRTGYQYEGYENDGQETGSHDLFPCRRYLLSIPQRLGSAGNRPSRLHFRVCGDVII